MTALVSHSVSESVIPKKEWNRILDRIDDGKVIPVIGDDLSVISPPDRPDQAEGLAARLANALELSGDTPSSLNELALRYLHDHPRNLEDLYADVFQNLSLPANAELPLPLRQLADIRSFGLFVTTSFDPYLAWALNEVRFDNRMSTSTRVLAYERSARVDIPPAYKSLDFPIVYHLFGKAQAAPLFAVTDEDVLEFMHKLQSPECVPPNLFDALREQRLLVLGTRLCGWLARFFLRISSSDRLRDARRADYLVDLTTRFDTDQTLFFETFGEVKLLPIAAVDFVNELHTRWKERHPDADSMKVPAGSSAPVVQVFLSYASEDLQFAKALRERLEREAHVRVWLDKDALRAGDNWESRIADTLRTCDVCIPLISANVKNGVYRYVRAEWQEAVRLQKGRSADKPFILPILLDDTRPDDPALEPEIRALHWHRLHDADEMKKFMSGLSGRR